MLDCPVFSDIVARPHHNSVAVDSIRRHDKDSELLQYKRKLSNCSIKEKLKENHEGSHACCDSIDWCRKKQLLLTSNAICQQRMSWWHRQDGADRRLCEKERSKKTMKAAMPVAKLLTGVARSCSCWRPTRSVSNEYADGIVNTKPIHDCVKMHV